MKHTDGFTLYRDRRKRTRRLSPSSFQSCQNTDSQNVECCFEDLVAKIDACLEHLKASAYLAGLIQEHQRLTQLCQSDSLNLTSIVCYGLGSFSRCKISRYQLALLLLLTELVGCRDVHIYDPVFNEVEKQLLVSKLNLHLIDFNENCCRAVAAHQRILFFMPHCEKSMYNNLLWSNWTLRQLSNLFILGNSFTNMFNTVINKRVRMQFFTYLHHVVETFSEGSIELIIKNTFDVKDAFNDLAFQAFDISKFDVDLFKDSYSDKEPVYCDDF